MTWTKYHDKASTCASTAEVLARNAEAAYREAAAYEMMAFDAIAEYSGRRRTMTITAMSASCLLLKGRALDDLRAFYQKVCDNRYISYDDKCQIKSIVDLAERYEQLNNGE